MITEPFELKKLFARAMGTYTPLSGTFELTNRCNFNCKMCYIHHGCCESTELTTEQWKKIISDSAQRGTLFALLTGGEPLLRDDFCEIYKTCAEHGMLVSVNTNGSLIDDRMIQFFKKYPPHRINVSMYGTSPQTYESLCENKSAYEKTTQAIIKLKQAGLTVKINLSISGANAADIKGVFDFGKKYNVQVQPSTYMFRPVRREKDAVDSYTRDEPEITSAYTLECMQLQNTPETFTRMVQEVKAMSEIKPDYAAHKILKPCRAGQGAFWVSSQGHMMACGMMPDIYCDLIATDFDTAWASITQDASKLTLPKECSICKYRHTCDVCAASYLSESGGTGPAPQYQCRRAKELYKLMIKSGLS